MNQTQLADINDRILTPALALLPAAMDSLSRRRLLLTIGEQETDFATTVQYGNGPAHSYWQDEEMGGIRGVLDHPHTHALAVELCTRFGVAPDHHSVWLAFASPDFSVMAAAWAALLLLCEVVLDKPFETFASDCHLPRTLPKGHDSTWGKGQNGPDPKQSIKLGDITVPLGKAVDTGARAAQAQSFFSRSAASPGNREAVWPSSPKPRRARSRVGQARPGKAWRRTAS